VRFEAVDPELDEAPWKGLGLSPRELVVTLATEKAQAVLRRRPGCLVLGADQVADVDGRILGKPGDDEHARAQLRELQGRTHHLWTGVALAGPGPEQIRSAVDQHRMVMRPLDADAITRYVAREDVRGCAGSYRVEGLGAALFSAMEGRDWTGIVGLPLLAVVRMLVEAGQDPL
jgi:septum formation protein